VKIKKTEVVFSDDIEKNIYDLLLLESLNTDEIANKLSLEINVALLKISILELSNLIKKGDSGKYEVV
jgi:predicted transcriptional regulator